MKQKFSGSFSSPLLKKFLLCIYGYQKKYSEFISTPYAFSFAVNHWRSIQSKALERSARRALSWPLVSTYFNMLQLLYVTFRCSVDHQISRHFYKKIVSSLFLPFLLRCRPFLPRCTSLMFTFQQSLPPIVPNNY